MRDLTLQSTAPALVYEEGSLIKRAIRDLYTKDVDEVLVEGDDGLPRGQGLHEDAHAEPRQEREALQGHPAALLALSRSKASSMRLYSPTVTLPSGGYMVINQTEALVSIDINSGKATREHNIEDTALKTNLEASDEIARQLRLRDLAGLIVIDFIDMEEKRNNRAVERRLKEALKNDRARIQVGRISHFGLLEMSRQRLRPGLLEGSTQHLPALRRPRHRPFDFVLRPVGAARHRGTSDQPQGREPDGQMPPATSPSTSSTRSATICCRSRPPTASRSSSCPEPMTSRARRP